MARPFNSRGRNTRKLQGSKGPKPGKFFSLRSRLEAGSAPITGGRPPRTPRRGGSVASHLACIGDGWLNLTASLALRTDTSAQTLLPSSNLSLFASLGSHAPSKLGYLNAVSGQMRPGKLANQRVPTARMAWTGGPRTGKRPSEIGDPPGIVGTWSSASTSEPVNRKQSPH